MGKARTDLTYSKGGDGMMQKAIMYRAYNGVEIIDTRPEAEIAYSNMKYAEELYTKRKQRQNKEHKSFTEILSALLL